MKLPLSLTLRTDSLHRDGVDEAAAVLILGCDPDHWLAVLCECSIPMSRLKYFPLVSRTANDPNDVFGVLVAGDAVRDHITSLRRLTQTDRKPLRMPLQFYRCIAGRFYIPEDATLSAHVTENELRSLLPAASESQLVWHPSEGLIEFEADQILTTAILLSGPRRSNRTWDSATRGESLNGTLRSLNPSITLADLQSLIGQGRGDIGNSAEEIDQAPPAPNELPASSFHELLRRMKQRAANAVFRMTDALPKSPGGSRFLGRLHQWASSVLNSGAGAAAAAGGAAAIPTPEISIRRENELKRLMHMLQNDPDLGLRYAIPLGGDSSRGTSGPSGRLSEQSPDFNLSQLKRSGPADSWDVPPQYYSQLNQRYRELAQREARLGNHRRAAYIYASLLNDLHSAAAVLEAGRLFRDAATIYQSHLNQPLRAALCLKNGGMWEEAVVIYREHRQWLTAGELYGLLNQPDLAREMFRLELNEIIKRKDYLAAATLADQRLNDRPLGWQLLKDGWRQHCRGAECLRRLYEQYGSTGEHQRMESDLVGLLSLPSLLKTQLSDGVTICAEIAVKYPFEPIREQARRQTFQIASSILESEFSSASQAALLAVQNLAKEDELLVRDVSRFTNLQRSENHRRKPAGKPTRNSSSDVSKLATIQVFPRIRLNAEGLPTNATWTSAVASSDCLFCLGDANDHRVYVGRWPLSTLQPSALPSGTCIPLDSSAWTQGSAARPHLLANPSRPERVNLQYLPISNELAGGLVQQIARANSFVDALKLPGSIIVDVRILNDGRLYAVVCNDDNVQLVIMGKVGIPSLSFSLILPTTAIRIMISQGGTILLQDLHLLLIAGTDVLSVKLPSRENLDIGPATLLRMETICELDSPAVSICPAGQSTEPRVMIATESSCYAVWPATRDACRVASDLEKPVIGVTSNGIFLIAADDEISAYHLNNQRTIRFARVSLPTSTFVALVSDKSLGSILAVRNDHTVIRLSVPAP